MAFHPAYMFKLVRLPDVSELVPQLIPTGAAVVVVPAALVYQVT
jgi:hypothetical protein